VRYLPIAHRNRFLFVSFPRFLPAAVFRRSPGLVAWARVGLLPAVRGAEPASAAAEVAAWEAKGSLVIVGGGGMPDAVRERFLELGGGPQAHLVVIPTASDKADHPELLKNWPFWKSQKVASVELLHTRDRKQADDPAFIKPLTEATAVWLSGGDQARLIAAYRGTAVQREMQRVLARGGVIGGTSAGAAVMSSLMITGGYPTAEIDTGFGFLPGVVIDQHFHNRNRLPRLQGVLKEHPEYLGVGIDESTAIVVREGAATVVGKADVSLCLPSADPDKPDVREYRDGARLDLANLCRRLSAGRATMPPDKATASNQRTTLSP